jgi:hypothetical protein
MQRCQPFIRTRVSPALVRPLRSGPQCFHWGRVQFLCPDSSPAVHGGLSREVRRLRTVRRPAAVGHLVRASNEVGDQSRFRERKRMSLPFHHPQPDARIAGQRHPGPGQRQLVVTAPPDHNRPVRDESQTWEQE